MSFEVFFFFFVPPNKESQESIKIGSEKGRCKWDDMIANGFDDWRDAERYLNETFGGST